MSDMPKLSGIYIYPVKSLAGIRVTSWPVIETGFLYDRKWMLIDGERQFLSQRKLPKMALIITELANDGLILSAEGMPICTIPLTYPNDGELFPCQVWHDQCMARHVSNEVDQWLTDFLHLECRLVYLPDQTIRPVDTNYAIPTDRVAFSDGFPFLIVSDASLNALNQEMQLNLSMRRFRPNLVISDCLAYEEDFWREIGIGQITFRLPKPCSRCIVPTIDPDTAETGKEPLVTLSRIRKWQGKIYFGQNALHNQCGELRVGDIVRVISSGNRQPPI